MKKTICPKCGAREVLPIMYGLPTIEAAEKAKRGEIILGGCCIDDSSPTHECMECHYGYLKNVGNLRSDHIKRLED